MPASVQHRERNVNSITVIVTHGVCCKQTWACWHRASRNNQHMLSRIFILVHSFCLTCTLARLLRNKMRTASRIVWLVGALRIYAIMRISASNNYNRANVNAMSHSRCGHARAWFRHRRINNNAIAHFAAVRRRYRDRGRRTIG